MAGNASRLAPAANFSRKETKTKTRTHDSKQTQNLWTPISLASVTTSDATEEFSFFLPFGELKTSGPHHALNSYPEALLSSMFSIISVDVSPCI